MIVCSVHILQIIVSSSSCEDVHVPENLFASTGAQRSIIGPVQTGQFLPSAQLTCSLDSHNITKWSLVLIQMGAMTAAVYANPIDSVQLKVPT